VAAINGLEVTHAEDFKMGETNRTPEFLAKFPLGKVPALECADGFCLAESAAIAAYLAGRGPAAEQLLGPLSEPQTRARIFEWGCFAESEVVPNVMPAFVMAVIKVVPFNEKLYDHHAGALTRATKRLELALQGGKKFLVGDKLSLADIMVASPLFFSLGFLFDAEMRKDVPETVRYLEGLAAMPEFSKFFGELKMGETRVKP
jgi:elongation factor 1-gamma